MVSRKVSARGKIGTITEWTPLLSSMCDALILFDDSSECWYASRELKPVDGLGPLPSRQEAIERARIETLESLKQIRCDLIAEWNKPWPGMEFGKAHLGIALSRAIEELDPSEKAPEVETRRASDINLSAFD